MQIQSLIFYPLLPVFETFDLALSGCGYIRFGTSGRGYLCLRVALTWITYENFDNFWWVYGQRIQCVCVSLFGLQACCLYIE